MITNFLFQLLNKFNIASIGFRKFLTIFISLMIFGLILAVYKFTKLEVPNFTRNLLLLASLDIGGFFLLSWKKNKTPEPIPTPPPTQPIPETPPQNETKIERLQEIEQVETQLNEENEVDKLMKEIIEENKEKIDEMEKEMGIQ